jgi:DNA-binding beta-propeller fold protein YncE
MIRAGRRHLLFGFAGAIGGVPATSSRAATEPFDIRRYVYVPSATSPNVTVIDTETNLIAGTLHAGIVARQAVVSRESATLIATDGRSASISLVNVVTGSARAVSLPNPAERLTVGTTGWLAAASDLAGGTIAMIDLGDERPDKVSTIRGLPPLRDAMFGDLDTAIYIAAEGLGGIGVVNVGQARLTGEIAPVQPSPNGFATMARSLNGRQILALPPGGGPIGVFDPERGQSVGRVEATVGATGMFPSGTGRYLLVPNSVQATLAVFRSEPVGDPVLLPATAGVTGVYTGWLDSVAFLPSPAGHSVLVYDLDTMRRVDEIALRGRPGSGAVTPDSRTLFLPVSDPPQVVAIDAATRKIAAVFDLAEPPLAALVAGAWGVCH